MSEIIKKKRGRKPKNLIMVNKPDPIEQEPEIINTDEENIILHLAITKSEIINNDNDNMNMSLFIKSEKDLVNGKLNLKQINVSDDSDTTETLKTSSQVNPISGTYNSVNKIITHSFSFTKNTKCWWCKNTFENPPVQMPEDYYNGTFYCTGHFCGFNCIKAYNLDTADSLTWKRDSLINLLYYQTFLEYKEIIVAPHWLTLIEFGGELSIQEFRKNFIELTKEYLVLHPPLISRQMQIEESYKFNKLREVPIDNLNKMYSEIESDYVIKRNKPLQSAQLNLETTMGLIKSRRRK
jgi:hypothetical protein